MLNTFLGNGLERWAKRYQIRRITANPLTQHLIGHVVYDDTQLAFHPDSPEVSIVSRYRSVLQILTK